MKKKTFEDEENSIFLPQSKPLKIQIGDIVSVKQKMEKFLEKIRKKKNLKEIKEKIEENLNPEKFSSDAENNKSEEQKAFSEIHKMLLIRNAKNEPYFLELEELFCFKSIAYQALFHEDDKPFLYLRNAFNAVRK